MPGLHNVVVNDSFRPPSTPSVHSNEVAKTFVGCVVFLEWQPALARTTTFLIRVLVLTLFRSVDGIVCTACNREQESLHVMIEQQEWTMHVVRAVEREWEWELQKWDWEWAAG